jgi:phytoene/squalene synthetase
MPQRSLPEGRAFDIVAVHVALRGNVEGASAKRAELHGIGASLQLTNVLQELRLRAPNQPVVLIVVRQDFAQAVAEMDNGESQARFIGSWSDVVDHHVLVL